MFASLAQEMLNKDKLLTIKQLGAFTWIFNYLETQLHHQNGFYR